MLGCSCKMLSSVSCRLQLLTPQRSNSRLIMSIIQRNEFSGIHSQKTQGLKIHFNRLLTRPSFQKTSWRWFRVKRCRPSTDANPSVVSAPKNNLSRPQSVGKSSTNSDSKNFWTFAIKMGAYTVGFTTLAFGSCAIWQQTNRNRDHSRSHNNEIVKRRGQGNSKSQTDLAYMWNHLPMVHKVTYAIIGLNLLVWAGWKVASQQTMMKWFTLSLNSSQKHLSNMFLSMFSHKSFIHFYVNMYVLSSFSVAWDRLSFKGNTTGNSHERFVAFYLTAGMCSGLLSILIKYVGRIPHPSLGASGATMGLVGYVCEKMPDTRLGIVFVPNWTFSAHSAKNAIIAFDTVGLLIGAFSKWRYMFFDHAGHLGGILFGIWYARGGERVLNDFSQFIMRLQQGKR